MGGLLSRFGYNVPALDAAGLGGAMLQALGTWSVGFLGGLIMLGALVVIRRRVLTISEFDMVSCSAEA